MRTRQGVVRAGAAVNAAATTLAPPAVSRIASVLPRAGIVGLAAAAWALVAAAEPLPADLARVTITATGTLGAPYALVHLYSQDGFKGYVVVNSAGDIVWYYRTKDYPFGAARRRSGNFVFMDKGRGIVEVTAAGTVVHELAQRRAEEELHHDLLVTPRDTVLYLAFDTRVVGGKPLKGEAIWEWSPETGEDVKRWRSWDHLDPLRDRGARTAGEWLHANSLAIGPRGNVLVSLHYLNQVISITSDWQRLEWRLGGINATVAVPLDQAFSGQHTAHELAPGRVLMFDNGRDRGGFSRVVEWALEGATARPLWQWRPPQDNYASAISSARRLPNGDTLVAFGMSAGQAGSTGPTEAYEVTPGGRVVWHLRVAGVTTMFRVEPLWAAP